MPDKKEDVDGFLDEAIGTIGGMLGEMGYAAPPQVPGPLECPSGRLVFADIAALPPANAPDGLHRVAPEGRPIARGAIVRREIETWTAYVPESIPGEVNHLMLMARQGRAVKERTIALVRPHTGVFLFGDATLLRGLSRAPRRLPPVLGDFGARETAYRIARENGARLGPDAMRLLDQTARTGLWVGVLGGRDALAVNLGRTRPLRLLEGRDEEGRTVYVRVDALRDGVLADPKLRAMVRREQAEKP